MTVTNAKNHLEKKVNLNKHKLRNPHDRLDSECSECGKIFQSAKNLHSKYRLRLHMKRKHQEPTNTCGLCSEVFIYRNGLQKHISKHENNHKMYFCLSCDDKFIIKESLRKHKIYVHNIKPVKYGKKCSICGIQVKPKLFKEHYSTHMESCKKCDFRGVNIVKHMVKHNGVNCNTCQKTLSTPDSLLAHQKDVHGIFDKNRHIHMCDKCNSWFQTLEVLKRHQTKIHNIILQCEKVQVSSTNKK